MPRITAGTVAEHVARQETAVFEAAIRLFAERGYEDVSLGDIAAEVGLARSSLYRYFPDKAHILLRWYRAELPAQIARSEELLSVDGAPIERIRGWVDDQLDYAARPEHRLIATLAQIAPELDAPTRAELAAAHQHLLAPLDAVLRDAGVARAADRAAVTELIGGIVLAAAQREQVNGRSPRTRRLVIAAVGGLLSAPPAR